MSAKITDRLVYKAGMARVPISGTFELTPMCNFSCKMCYVRKNAVEVEALGGLKAVEQWLEWAKEAKEKGMLYLLITGGEPLTYPGFWELYEGLIQMGFIITVNTNGSLITDEVAQRFAKMQPKKINITLYGASNESYARLCGAEDGFDRVMKAVEILEKYKLRYKFNCSLTPYNYHELREIYDLSRIHKVPIEIATYMFPPVRRDAGMEDSAIRLSPEQAGYCSVEQMRLQLSEEQFLAYARQKITYQRPPELPADDDGLAEGREMGCRAGRCSFWLDWQGNIAACGMINSPKYSLEEETFARGWEQVVDSTNKIRCLTGCSGCKNRKLCHTCISSAYCETGDINGRPVYICRMIEAEAKACKEILLELDKKGDCSKDEKE